MVNRNLKLAKRLVRIARNLVAMGYQYVADTSTNAMGDVIRWGYEDEWHHKMNGFTGLIDFGKSSCRVKDAYFTLNGDMIEWEKGWLMQGTFYGNWESGTNDGGTFIGGVMLSCDWLSGDFTGGEARSGVVFHSGNLTGGTIVGSLIDGAVINGADCNGCEFQKGKFLSGSWENGKWLSSTQPEPTPPKVRTLSDNVDFHAEMEKAIREHKTVKFNYMKRDGEVELITFLPIELKSRGTGEICIGWKNGDEGNEEMKRTLHVKSMGSLNVPMQNITSRKLNVSDTDNPPNIQQLLENEIGKGEFVTWVAETENGNVFLVTGKPTQVSPVSTKKPTGYVEEKLMCTFEATNGQTVRYGVKIHPGPVWEKPNDKFDKTFSISMNGNEIDVILRRSVEAPKNVQDWQENGYYKQVVEQNHFLILDDFSIIQKNCKKTATTPDVVSVQNGKIVISKLFKFYDMNNTGLIANKITKLGYRQI